MKIAIFFFIASLLLGGLPLGVFSQDSDGPENSILITAQALKAQLGDERLRILDVRSEEQYLQAHIPGAVRVDVSDWKSLAVTEEGLRDAEGWSKKIGAVGITNESKVVVYGGKLSDAARIWWLLKYVGVENAVLLDGGWDWWSAEVQTTESSTAIVNPSSFVPDFQSDRLAEMDSVKESLGSQGFKVVDTRSDGEFESGRISDAVHLEWTQLLNDDGRFKSRTELNDIFREKGIVPTDTATCY